MQRTLSGLILFLWLLSACATPMPDLPAPTREPAPTAVPSATALNSQASATVTILPPSLTTIPAPPFPSSTPTRTNDSPTPPFPMAWSPDGSAIQCYKGPGVEYEPSYVFGAAEIVGKDETGQWWYLKFFDKRMNPLWCWVNSKQTNQGGDLSSISVTEAETASVTTVKIIFNGGDTQLVPCGQPTAQPEFHFSGKIITSGPVEKLRYQWVTDAETKFPPEQIQVLAWDNPAWLKLNLSVPARDGIYSLTLRTISPNEVVSVVRFVVKCQ